MSLPTPGERVHVAADVLSVRDDDRPAYQQVELRLPDGQKLVTHPGNLAELPAPLSPLAEDAPSDVTEDAPSQAAPGETVVPGLAAALGVSDGDQGGEGGNA